MADPLAAPRLLVCRGSRAAETLLLDEIERLLAEAEAEPALLARPVRVVVPSASLRRHLAAALIRRRRRAAAGVSFQTHFALALEVVEGAGEAARPGRLLQELLPQRLARRHRALRQPLEELVDGYAAVAATVRDLLDAGFEPPLADGLDEILAGAGRRAASGAELERARSLVRVAAETFDTLEAAGIGSTPRLLRRAAELLEAHGGEALPARAVLVCGYADATGTVTDLLQALQRHLDARVVLDRPPDPVGEGAAGGAGEAFGRRFTERLARLSAPVVADLAPTAATVDAFTARGAEGEVWEAARRIQALLAGGARPEGIAVAARDPGLYRRHLRRRLPRLGIPFSGPGTPGPPTPGDRRAFALLELLRRGPRTPAERWLESLEVLPLPGGGEVPLPADLRLALAAVGAGRLGDVAELDVRRLLAGRTSLPLPARAGLRGREDDGEETEGPEEQGARVVRRRLEGQLLEAAVGAARGVLARLDRWPREATLEEHRSHLEGLGAGGLPDPLVAAVDSLAGETPGDFRLAFDELRLLLGRAVETAAGCELGGAGGGVQVLSVTEARGQTFEHLFVLGLQRGVFPRPVREDPLLPDDLRKVLLAVLPDLPLKAAGFDEERHLFAQLLAASPRVTLSWQRFDEAGAPRAPSPLVERLTLPEVAEAPLVWAPAAAGAAPRPAAEEATVGALHGGREHFRRVFPAAVEASREGLAGEPPLVSPAALAGARLAVLDELDPELGGVSRLGPFFGFVGPPDAGEDPRHEDLYVTVLERLAGCPWQVFLTRLLGLEPTPDPLEALPGSDPLALGQVVHRALERVAREGPDWPSGERLDAWLGEAAEAVLREEGIPLPGLAHALGRTARPYLDAAREEDWSAAPPAVEAVEAEGSVAVADAAGRPRTLHFRADRVDLEAGGARRRTDYKTGRPPRKSGRELSGEKRIGLLLDEVAAGGRLQAVAYALAEGPEAGVCRGRYLFLRPDTEHRDYTVEGGDETFAAAFRRAVAALLAAWDAGTFFPRLTDPRGRSAPPRCTWCPVREACLLGDSGARLRLVEWCSGGGRGSGEPWGEALRGVWRLPLGEAARDDRDDDRGGGEEEER